MAANPSYYSDERRVVEDHLDYDAMTDSELDAEHANALYVLGLRDPDKTQREWAVVHVNNIDNQRNKRRPAPSPWYRFILWLIGFTRPFKDLQSYADKLEADHEKVLMGEVTFKSMAFERGHGFTAVVGCRLAADLGTVWLDWLNEVGAENYIEQKLTCPDGSFLVVTIKRERGKSPHDLRNRAEINLLCTLNMLVDYVNACGTPLSSSQQAMFDRVKSELRPDYVDCVSPFKFTDKQPPAIGLESKGEGEL